MLRLLIADDEELVRRGLVAVIARDAPEIEITGTAVDGEDALEQAQRVVPDAVLTDIHMPGVNGLDLIQRLRATHPRLRCVILSGYDEFDYARRAVSLGVAEYLLKPVDPDELLALLRRIASEVETERRERRLRQASAGITREQSARWLLDGVPVDDELLAGAFPSAPAWGLALIQNPSTAEDRQTLRDACEAGLEHSVLVDDAYGYLCVLVPLPDSDLATAAAMGSRLSSALQERQIASAVTVGRPSTDLVGVGDAHGEALEAAEYHSIGAGSATLLSWDVLSQSAERWPAVSPERRDALLEAVAQGLEADAQREAREFVAYARAHVPPGGFRALWSEIVVLLVNRVQQFGVRADALLEPRQDLRSLLAAPTDVARQEEQLVSLAARAARECWRVRTQHSPRATIRELREYIADHLADDLTIAVLAQRMHLTAKYLGEVFKQSTGESLGEYIIRARIKRACDLLGTTSLKVHVIAEHVGYGDPKHFATMFRSLVGVSPVEYRGQCRVRQEGET